MAPNQYHGGGCPQGLGHKGAGVDDTGARSWPFLIGWDFWGQVCRPSGFTGNSLHVQLELLS